MTIRQLHYTSCQHGREGTQGFQVSAASAGLTEQHEDLGLRLSAYRPSPSAPMQPTPEQIKRFPVAVGYQPCGEVAVLFHSRYLGADFTGRQGNYFAHILVLDAPDHDLNRMLPIEAWGSPLWCWQPTQDTRLPLVEEITPGPLADRERIRGYLLDGRLPEFATLLSAVQDGLVGRATRVVVVAPDAVDVARALAAVTCSLPTAHARAVSFITFTSSPADADVLVAGTTPDVEISPSPFGDRIVITLFAEGSGDRSVSRFASVLRECWNRGLDAVRDAGVLAARISPPLQPSELDRFAELVELVVLSPVGPIRDLLGGVEFALQRLPAVLTPQLWQQLDERSRQSGSFDDVERWSAVFAAADQARCAPGPELESTYLRAALSRIAAGVLAPDKMWLPVQMDGRRREVVLEWAASTMRTSHQFDTARQFDTATSVLSTLSRLRIRLPSPSELQDAVVEVVLAVLCDPQQSETPSRLRQLPEVERLLPLACRTLDNRLTDNDELIDMVVEGLSLPAAELVAAHAPRGSRCAMTASLAAARARRTGRVEALLRAVRTPARAADVERFANLLWPDPPSATEGVQLCRGLDNPVLAATTLPQRLLDRLIEDAESNGLSAADEELADLLTTSPLADQLANGLDTAECVCWGAHFNSQRQSSRKRDQEAVDAVRSSAHAAAAVAAWTREAVVNWMLSLAEPTHHGPVLLRVLQESGSPDFLTVYSRQLADKLASAKPSAIAALLPAVVFAAHHHQASQRLLDNACKGALRGRRKRDLDTIGRCFASDEPKYARLLPKTGRRAPKNWSVWWKEWREHNIPQSAFSRLLSRRRSDGD